MLLCALCAPRDAPAQQLVAGCIPGSNSTCAPWTPALLNGLSNTVVSVKAAPGILGAVYCYNPQGAAAHIQIFDAASTGAVTLGTTKPKLSFGIPTASANGMPLASVGIGFLAGIQVAVTTTATGASSSSMDCSLTFS